MNPSSDHLLATIFTEHENELLADWLSLQFASISSHGRQIKESDLRAQSREFMALLTPALQSGNLTDISKSEWAPVREFLAELSKSRARQGATASETASFVFSLKQPIFDHLRRALAQNPQALAQETWETNLLIDRLGLYSTEVYQRGREEMITRQQQELLELSTPVVKLWEGILALPLIGTLDSERTQVVMENLLQQIVNTGADIAIIDITGVPTVDTLVAQHLLKTVAAARLMGADCIISGIRPQIAQTIVHLGVELTNVITKATLADAFGIALQRRGLTVVPITRLGTR